MSGILSATFFLSNTIGECGSSRQGAVLFGLGPGQEVSPSRLGRAEYADVERAANAPAGDARERAARVRQLLPDIGSRTGPVFLSRLRKRYTSGGLRSILRRHGGVNPYSLRHTYAQPALQTQPMEVVAALLGHADLETVQTYCQIRDRRAVAAARTLRVVKTA